MILKANIVAAARRYVGTPFHHQARVPGIGLDCMGVPSCALQEAGDPRRRRVNYPRSPNGTLLRELDAQFGRIDPAQAEDGDLVIFVLQCAPRHPWHGGLLDGDKVIHACAAARQVVRETLTDELRSRIVAAYDLTAVPNG